MDYALTEGPALQSSRVNFLYLNFQIKNWIVDFSVLLKAGSCCLVSTAVNSLLPFYFQEEFPVLSPRESLIPAIKADDHNQRSF